MGVQWRKENPNPRVHRSSGKLGEPRFPLERVDPRVGIFLSPLDTHDGFYFTKSHCHWGVEWRTTSDMRKMNLYIMQTLPGSSATIVFFAEGYS